MSGIEKLDATSHRILELAYREALSLGSNEIKPVHLLLGILRHRDNDASHVLARHQVWVSCVTGFRGRHDDSVGET